MNTHTTRDGVLESVYTDADVERTIVAKPTPPSTENITYPPAVLKAFKRAKKASVTHDARSRKIAAALRAEREKKHLKKKVPHHSKRVQKMLGDF